MTTQEVAAPEILKLVGHDARWRLIRTLAESDRRVNELVGAVGLPQNLVSYHLRQLKDGELVEERRSAADARDIYYHLDLEKLSKRLSESARFVHPALAGPVSIPQRASRHKTARPRVLFICTGNSARSQLAEAVLRSQLGSGIEVHSAGPMPTEVHPLALEILREMHIDTAGLRSKGLDEVQQRHFDFVITLCDRAREVCPPDNPEAQYIHWSLPDPALVKGTSARRRAFRKTADEIVKRLRFLIPVLTHQLEG